MGHTVDEIPNYVMEWIPKQHVFWVASAPLTADGHVNISPKGVEGTFHVVNSRQVWYEDLSGSGAETISHIRENGRITILFNAFDGPPRIIRLYGKGTIYEIGTPEYDAFLPQGYRQPGSRSVIFVDVFKVGTTCGYAVPYYSFVGHRTQLLDWAEKKEALDRVPGGRGAKGMRSWWISENTKSLDGLPALRVATRDTQPIPISKPIPGREGVGAEQKTHLVLHGSDPLLMIVAFLVGVLVTSLSGRISFISGTYHTLLKIGT